MSTPAGFSRLALIALLLALTGCGRCGEEEPGSCTYTIRCEAESICSAGIVFDACVDQDDGEEIPDELGCEVYARDEAKQLSATYVGSEFKEGGDCDGFKPRDESGEMGRDEGGARP